MARLLIKMTPAQEKGLRTKPLGIDGTRFDIRPLLENEGLGKKGFAQDSRWYLAETNAAANAGEIWDVAYRAIEKSGPGGIVYAEPDVAHEWLSENHVTRKKGKLGAAPGELCGKNDQSKRFPQGNGFAWHLGDNF